MLVKDFRTLVNEAILETKVTLDPLTAANFASPPRTLLYNNFKGWVNKAYKDLMLERPDWFFRKERTQLQLRPRLHLSGLSYIPSVGDVLVSTESAVRFEVKGVYNFEDNELDPVVERTVDVEYLDGTSPANFQPQETLDREFPTVATNVGFVRSPGRYSFSEVAGLDQIDPDNVKVFYADGNVGHKIQWVDYTNWIYRWNYYPYTSSSHPDAITQAPDGNFEFFPLPTTPFTVEFDYTRKYDDLVEHDDLPIGVDPKYQDLLIWKAIAEYADFDNNAKVFARAAKNIEKYTYYMTRDELPRISFGSSKFFTTYGW